jgi:hypothetical protein
MNICKQKLKLSTIAIISVLTVSAIFVTLPAATAQESRITYPFLGAVPNPVGKGQPVLFHVGIFQQLSSAQMSWKGLSITIERPDGQTDTISGINTDSTGGTGRVYTPDQVGTYYCQTHFPEIVVEEGVNEAPRIPIGTVMLASESDVLELVVQDEPIDYYPGQPLPSEYWTRPIDAQLREWKAVAGNWLVATQGFPLGVSGNAEAPETAHILWTKPLYMGGVSGATGTSYADWSFSHGDAYEGKWGNRLIINGILIYTHRTNTRPLVYTAVDVRTGEELWNKVLMDNRTIAFGQNLVWGGYNHHAVYPYFWVSVGNDWHAFDPSTGEREFTVENVPSGTTVFDDQGWLYQVYIDNSGSGYIWSMVDFFEPFEESSPTAGSWVPAGSFYGGRYGYWDAAEVANETTGELTEACQRAYIAEFTWDASRTPGSNLGRWGSAVRAMEFSASRQFTNMDEWTGKIFGLQYSSTEVKTWAISLDAGMEGTILFSETWNAPSEWAAGNIEIEFNAVDLESGAAAIWEKDNLAYHAFSTDTGKHLWGPTEGEYYMNYYGWTELVERPPFIWEGKLYSSGAGGHIYCYDLTDGEVLWTYLAEDPYQEYLFANYWWQHFLFITDGKLYSAHMEHSAIETMPRGAPFLCLDANTGELIWEADGLFRSTRWGGRGIIGDSVMVGYDTYDNRIYAVGKGPSAITIDKTMLAVGNGSTVTVQGTVMDVSPGTEDTETTLRFPDGVPAISDEDQSKWMKYVYKQLKTPGESTVRPDATGVTVKIEVVDPNNNYQMLGTTTSDAYGNWAFTYCYELPGTYMIIATFEGSGAYYGSAATSYLTVVEQMPIEAHLDPVEQSVSDVEDAVSSVESSVSSVESSVSSVESSVSNLTTYLLVILVIGIISLIVAVYSLMRSRQ